MVDEELSTISFEISVLFAKNVRGTFKNIEGFIEIDLDKKENNKAIFSVVVNSIDMNYAKYRDLLLSDIFFDAKQFPIVVVDTKKFSYQNEKKITLDVELIIKGKSEIVPLAIFVKRLGEELVQIESELNFSRTYFNIGTGKWSNTAILKDKATIKTNLFLFKE
jgi:polyisoprenoid-binding protein YceI